MKLKWTRQALRQILDAQDYIARDNPHAAQRVVERIVAASRRLMNPPQIGKPGRIPGTREWVVAHTPYFIVYVHARDSIQIIRVLHSKQNWPPEP